MYSKVSLPNIRKQKKRKNPHLRIPHNIQRHGIPVAFFRRKIASPYIG